MKKNIIYAALASFVFSASAQAAFDDTQLAVWANEAIVATYSFKAANFLARQKEIAKYFTSEGWIAYSTALNASKLPEIIKENSYQVSSVATLPPVIKSLAPNHWQAQMPLLVVYQNPQYKQKQTLDVIITFTQAPAGQGVRGLAITSLQSKVAAAPCECQPGAEPETKADGQQQSPNAKQSTTPIKQ